VRKSKRLRVAALSLIFFFQYSELKVIACHEFSLYFLRDEWPGGLTSDFWAVVSKKGCKSLVEKGWTYGAQSGIAVLRLRSARAELRSG